MSTKANTDRGYGQRELEARAARLQSILDSWSFQSNDFVEGIKLEIWALRVAVRMVQMVEGSLRDEARERGLDVNFETLRYMRDEAMSEILARGLDKLA